MRFEAESNGETVAIEVTGQGGRYRVAVGDEVAELDAREVAEGIWSILIGSVSHVVDVSERDGVSVVEVDGGQHSSDIHAQRDARRDGHFVRGGFRVLRFWNNDVDRNLEGVLTLIEDALRKPHPPPFGRHPPLAGEG